MINKKILVLFLVIFITSFISLAIYLNVRIVDDNTGFILKDNLDVSVYSNLKISDLIKSMDGKLLTDEIINTDSLGSKKVSFIYVNKENKKRRGTFNVNVVDDEKPLVWLSNSYSIKVNSDVNLEDSIMCADNYDSNPSCKIIGDYDLNKVGSYDLSYVATDSSNNKNKVDFTLYVYEPKEDGDEKNVSVTNFDEVLSSYKTKKSEVGIDVSKWQGKIDFNKVKEAGASFVMIRVGSQNGVNGEYVIDPYFETNVSSAIKSGLKVGVYFYSYADSKKEAKKQAKWVIEKIKKYQITLPVAFDWECYSSFNEMDISLFGLNEIADSFLKEVEKNGYEVMLYGSKNYLNSVWKYNKNDVWLAHYSEKTDYQNDFVMWQLCQNGVIDGIEKMVDINVLYHD